MPFFKDSSNVMSHIVSEKPFAEDGGEVGILCHSTDDEKSTIQGVVLPKGVKESSLVRVKCKGDDFKNLDTGKTVVVEKVSCTGIVQSSKFQEIYYIQHEPKICTGKGFEPVVQVMGDSVFESCSKVGVDGRKDDLIGSMVLIQIGWDIPEFGFSPQVCLSHPTF